MAALVKRATPARRRVTQATFDKVLNRAKFTSERKSSWYYMTCNDTQKVYTARGRAAAYQKALGIALRKEAKTKEAHIGGFDS